MVYFTLKDFEFMQKRVKKVRSLAVLTQQENLFFYCEFQFFWDCKGLQLNPYQHKN